MRVSQERLQNMWKNKQSESEQCFKTADKLSCLSLQCNRIMSVDCSADFCQVLVYIIFLFLTIHKKQFILGKGTYWRWALAVTVVWKPSVRYSSKESSICLNLIEAVSGNIFLPVAAENPETWLFCLSCALVMILIK